MPRDERYQQTMRAVVRLLLLVLDKERSEANVAAVIGFVKSLGGA